jgi:hypothetical protein
LLLQDSHIATAVLDLSQLNPAAMSYLELPLTFEKAKHAAAGGQARLVVRVKGWISSFGTLLTDTQHIPGERSPVNRCHMVVKAAYDIILGFVLSLGAF